MPEEAQTEENTIKAPETEEETAASEEEGAEEAAGDQEGEASETAESGEENPESETVESWMQSDDESEGEKKFSDGDIAAAKRKLKAKLSKELDDKDDEIARLRSQLQGGAQDPQAGSVDIGPMPTLEGCEYDDAKYQQALTDWHDKRTDAKIAAASNTRQQSEAQKVAQAEHSRLIDSHYDRAAKLAQDSGIKPETYQASDLAVRQAVDSVPALKGKADDVVDFMIANLGEGSEKLMYYMGRNAEARNKLVNALQADSTGVKAGILLGEMKGKLTQPLKKTSKAAKPAKRAEGDTSASDSGATFKRKYDRAKTPQQRFDIRSEARKSGVNVSHW